MLGSRLSQWEGLSDHRLSASLLPSPRAPRPRSALSLAVEPLGTCSVFSGCSLDRQLWIVQLQMEEKSKGTSGTFPPPAGALHGALVLPWLSLLPTLPPFEAVSPLGPAPACAAPALGRCPVRGRCSVTTL